MPSSASSSASPARGRVISFHLDATVVELAGQLERIVEITEAMGIRVVGIDGYEADDVIGTVAHMAGEAGIETVIATGDKDMLQLVNTTTEVIMLSGSSGTSVSQEIAASRSPPGRSTATILPSPDVP